MLNIEICWNYIGKKIVISTDIESTKEIINKNTGSPTGLTKPRYYFSCFFFFFFSGWGGVVHFVSKPSTKLSNIKILIYPALNSMEVLCVNPCVCGDGIVPFSGVFQLLALWDQCHKQMGQDVFVLHIF